MCRPGSFAAACLLAFGSASANADIITQYTAPGGVFTPTTVAAQVAASALNTTGSAASLQAGAVLQNTVFLLQNVLSPTPAASVANDQFFQFSAGADPGFMLNLSGLSFNVGRGGPSTPRGWAVRTSVDGFASTLASGDIPTQQPALTAASIDLSGPAFQSLASPVTLRVYGYAPGTGVGSFFDDITLSGTVAFASELVRYEAAGGSFAPTSTAANLTAGALNDTGSSADLQPGATLPNTVFLQQNITSANPAAAVANNQYFQFSLGPDAGFEMDLQGLSFNAARGGASTPRGWVLRSSLDGFGSDIATAEVATANPTLSSFGVDLSGPQYQDLQSALTFRLYGFAPSTGVGMFYDNLMVAGVVSAVPEPSTWLLMALGLAGFWLQRRRA